jgi:hypothetical protein
MRLSGIHCADGQMMLIVALDSRQQHAGMTCGWTVNIQRE